MVVLILFRLKGLKNLRVADGSAIPKVKSARKDSNWEKQIFWEFVFLKLNKNVVYNYPKNLIPYLQIMGANTNAPIIMIGERAADFIIKAWKSTNTKVYTANYLFLLTMSSSLNIWKFLNIKINKRRSYIAKTFSQKIKNHQEIGSGSSLLLLLAISKFLQFKLKM